MTKNYGRILLPVVTPFDKDENVNYEVFAQLVEYCITNKLSDSLVITGTTGEFNTLTFDERVKLFETAIKVNNGRQPIICGTGCGSTRETIALTQKAQELGADMALVVGPYYCKPTQRAIELHYRRIIESVDMDVMVYNIPIFVGVNIAPATLRELAKYKNVVGVKDEAGMNPTQITDYYNATKDIKPDFMLYNGDDIMLMPTLSQGAIGIVSGGSIIFGDIVHKAFDEYEAGNVQAATENARILYNFCMLCGVNGRIHPNPMLKCAITMVTGIDVGNARGPLDPVTDEERAHMREGLKKLGVALKA